MAIKNYYVLFNIDSKSDLGSVKKAFRREIAIYHPDNNKTEGAKERFNDLVEGFDILSDTEKKKAYDNMLEASKHNKPIVIEQKENYRKWQDESKTKSKNYRESSITEVLLLDIFGDIGLQGLLEGSKVLTEGSDSLMEGLGDALGDVVGGLFDGL